MKIGKYTIKRKLGEGAAGVTYLANEAISNKDVALKIYKNTTIGMKLLEDEVKPLLKLDNKHIVKYLDYNIIRDNQGNNVYYISTEYARNGSLREHLSGISVERAVDICQQILFGLVECHKLGIIHCDIKPDNILLDGNVVKIGDFGIAREKTCMGAAQGTPLYMAPEQLKIPGRTSRKSDLWSVGVVLYEMLYQRRPFKNIEDVASPGLSPEFKPIPLYPNIVKVIIRALTKKESRRFQSAEQFLRGVEDCFHKGVDNIVKAEQGVVGWDFDGEGYESREFDIKFSKKFGGTPLVHLSVLMLDSYTSDGTTRYSLNTEHVDTWGAKIRLSCWDNGKLWGCKVAWLAVGE